ncbi:MAG TPA: hypothetical protein VMF35_16010 [Acidimicrobiales bacterium]|nr:hypothetical protein [Acidimicrobiales bacterium]
MRPFDGASCIHERHVVGMFCRKRGEGLVECIPVGIVVQPLGSGDWRADEKDVRTD